MRIVIPIIHPSTTNLLKHTPVRRSSTTSTTSPATTPLRVSFSTFLQTVTLHTHLSSYAARDAALTLNLTYASTASAILRVDTSNTDSTTGRISARVESKQTYNSGLFIFDILHSPYGCSTWPALWLTDPSNWPLNGEIDVLEATNTASTGNQVTLHTTHNCKMDVKRKQSGKPLHNDCYNGTNANAGCGVLAPTNTIGAQFNANNGGVYVLEYRSAGIRTWFFDRSSIPLDISSTTLSSSSNSASPNPSTWGTPLADFPGTNCDITSHFRNMNIIANIDLCGQLAGTANLFSVESECPGTCVEYVSTQPGSAYSEAYWEFGGWWVFQADGA
jgi:hypothetical protein